MKAIVLKKWLEPVPDGAIVEIRGRYGEWESIFKMRVVYPLLVAEEEVEAKEEA